MAGSASAAGAVAFAGGAGPARIGRQRRLTASRGRAMRTSFIGGREARVQPRRADLGLGARGLRLGGGLHAGEAPRVRLPVLISPPPRPWSIRGRPAVAEQVPAPIAGSRRPPRNLREADPIRNAALMRIDLPRRPRQMTDIVIVGAGMRASLARRWRRGQVTARSRDRPGYPPTARPPSIGKLWRY